MEKLTNAVEYLKNPPLSQKNYVSRQGVRSEVVNEWGTSRRPRTPSPSKIKLISGTRKLNKEHIIEVSKTLDFCVCGEFKSASASYCKKCANNLRERTVWPSTTELLIEVDLTSYVAVAKRLGVSDNAVRKRIRNHKDSE